MRIHLHKDENAAAAAAAAELLDELTRKPDLVLGAPVGRSPVAVYRELVRAHQGGSADLSRLRVVLLDDFVGLDADDPRSHRRFLRERLLDPLGLPAEQVLLPPTAVADIFGACARFEEEIARWGGIDVQLLGIGATGHVGFNEPGASLASRTRVVTLTLQTLRDAAVARPEGPPIPDLAVTLGVGTILEARRILLVALGETKAAAVQRAVEGEVSAYCPATALQLHPDPLFVLDEAAASGLAQRVYYRRAQRNEAALRRGELPPPPPPAPRARR